MGAKHTYLGGWGVCSKKTRSRPCKQKQLFIWESIFGLIQIQSQDSSGVFNALFKGKLLHSKPEYEWSMKPMKPVNVFSAAAGAAQHTAAQIRTHSCIQHVLCCVLVPLTLIISLWWWPLKQHNKHPYLSRVAMSTWIINHPSHQSLAVSMKGHVRPAILLVI